ncbi:MAG: hypothetical protein WC243_03240 [Patescibacteria group bacterium]|jgi:hypothetical protein
MGILEFLLGIKKKKTVTSETVIKIKTDWKNVEVLLAGKSPSQLRQALITADKCLDNALRDIVEGNSLGERLKNGADLFDNITLNKIWEAHKIRNNIVHETNYEPPHYVLTDAVGKLKKGLEALGVRL